MQTQTNHPYRNGSDTLDNASVLAGLRDDSASLQVGETPPPASTEAQAHREHDLKIRRRDRYGNRLGWFYHFNIPSIEDLPLEQTSLGAAVAQIRESLPIRAAELSHFYDHKLRPAFRRLLAVRGEEETRLESYNAQARRSHAQADQEQRSLEDARDTATGSTRDTVVALDADLIAAHQEAATKSARVGGAYDPQPRRPPASCGMSGDPWKWSPRKWRCPGRIRTCATRCRRVSLGSRPH